MAEDEIEMERSSIRYPIRNRTCNIKQPNNGYLKRKISDTTEPSIVSPKIKKSEDLVYKMKEISKSSTKSDIPLSMCIYKDKSFQKMLGLKPVISHKENLVPILQKEFYFSGCKNKPCRNMVKIYNETLSKEIEEELPKINLKRKMIPKVSSKLLCTKKSKFRKCTTKNYSYFKNKISRDCCVVKVLVDNTSSTTGSTNDVPTIDDFIKEYKRVTQKHTLSYRETSDIIYSYKKKFQEDVFRMKNMKCIDDLYGKFLQTDYSEKVQNIDNFEHNFGTIDLNDIDTSDLDAMEKRMETGDVDGGFDSRMFESVFPPEQNKEWSLFTRSKPSQDCDDELQICEIKLHNPDKLTLSLPDTIEMVDKFIDDNRSIVFVPRKHNCKKSGKKKKNKQTNTIDESCPSNLTDEYSVRVSKEPNIKDINHSNKNDIKNNPTSSVIENNPMDEISKCSIDEFIFEVIRESENKHDSLFTPDESNVDAVIASTDEFNDDTSGVTFTKLFHLNNTSKEDVCEIMLDIVQTNETYLKFMSVCDTPEILKNKLQSDGISFPFKSENIKLNTVHFINIYLKWFDNECINGDMNYDMLTVSILKQMLLYIKEDNSSIWPTSQSKTSVESEINNSLKLLSMYPRDVKKNVKGNTGSSDIAIRPTNNDDLFNDFTLISLDNGVYYDEITMNSQDFDLGVHSKDVKGSIETMDTQSFFLSNDDLNSIYLNNVQEDGLLHQETDCVNFSISYSYDNYKTLNLTNGEQFGINTLIGEISDGDEDIRQYESNFIKSEIPIKTDDSVNRPGCSSLNHIEHRSLNRISNHSFYDNKTGLNPNNIIHNNFDDVMESNLNFTRIETEVERGTLSGCEHLAYYTEGEELSIGDLDIDALLTLI